MTAVLLTVELGWFLEICMQPNKPNYSVLADSICEMIREERNSVDEVLRDTARFLDELPDDLGRGSLNGWKVQLRHKIGEMLPPNY